MNYKAAFKYQIMEFKKSVVTFYIILLSIFAFFMVVVALSKTSSFNSTGAIEVSTSVFLFVAGLNCFKETFLMMMQNGISRKTMYISRIISMLSIAGIMSVIDRIIGTLFGRFSGTNIRFHVEGFYEQYFSRHASEAGFLQKHFEGWILTLLIYFAALAVGYFITTAYYRMNKALKVAVSVGVPVGLFIVLPLVDTGIAKGKISHFLGDILMWIFSYEKGLPYPMMITSLIAFLVFLILSWLLVRTATDKN